LPSFDMSSGFLIASKTSVGALIRFRATPELVWLVVEVETIRPLRRPVRSTRRVSLRGRRPRPLGWSGSTTPPGSSSLEGHSPGLLGVLCPRRPSRTPAWLFRPSCGTRKHTRGDCHFPKSLPSSASASSSPGCKLNALGDPPPPCNIWSGGFKWHDQIRGGTYKDREECLQISDFWKYGQHRRSSDFSSDAESRRGDDVLNSGLQGTRRASSFDALEVESDDSSVDALRGARPKLILPVPKHSPPKNSGFPDPSQPKADSLWSFREAG
ncbi:hypothetical protein MRX96_056195, partial [Rhipicephalus microplus]